MSAHDFETLLAVAVLGLSLAAGAVAFLALMTGGRR